MLVTCRCGKFRVGVSPYLDCSLNRCQLSFFSLWTFRSVSSLGSVNRYGIEKREKRIHESPVFYLTKLVPADVFSRKRKKKKEYILSRQGSSLFSNQSSRKKRQGEVEVVGETERRVGHTRENNKVLTTCDCV